MLCPLRLADRIVKERFERGALCACFHALGGWRLSQGNFVEWGAIRVNAGKSRVFGNLRMSKAWSSLRDLIVFLPYPALEALG